MAYTIHYKPPRITKNPNAKQAVLQTRYFPQHNNSLTLFIQQSSTFAIF
jgi:hypothetical protein